MVHFETDTFETGDYCFTVEFDSGGSAGGEITVYISDILGRPYPERVFYFDEQDDHHVRNFARKFGRDPSYRKACIDGTARWVRLASWYERNSFIYYDELLPVKGYTLGNKRQEREYRRREAFMLEKMNDLYRLLDRHLEELEGSEEYQEFQSLENQSPTPSVAALDVGIRNAVLLFNGIPGVKTEFCCQGITGSVDLPGWPFGPIWFPGKHSELAHVTFSEIPSELLEELVQFLQERGVGTARFTLSPGVQAVNPQYNAGFIAALEEFAGERCETVPTEEELTQWSEPRVAPPLTDKELAIAGWHFGNEMPKDELIQKWVELAERDKFNLARTYQAYRKIKKQLPVARRHFGDQLTEEELVAEWKALPGKERNKLINSYRQRKKRQKKTGSRKKRTAR